MTYPKVSIIWLNYNSRHMMDLVLRSLQGVHDLDYPDYELIVVDNGSTDGSFEIVKDFVEKRFGSKAKIVRLDKNLGFCGGVNVGFKARDPSSKYVVLLNNDAVPEPHSLRILVEEMEKRPYLGAAQGIIVDPKTGLIDSAGCYVSNYIFGGAYLRGEPPSLMKKPVYVSYADGAYSIWRVEAVLKANGDEKMFYDELFAYCDDIVLSLRMWSIGFKVASFPFISAKHSRGSTFRRVRPLQLHCSARCVSFLYHASEGIGEWNRFVIRLLYAKMSLTVPLMFRKISLFDVYRRAWSEGKDIASKVCRNGKIIDLTKAPLIKLRAIDLAKIFIARRYLRVDRNFVEKNFAFEE